MRKYLPHILIISFYFFENIISGDLRGGAL